MSQLAKPSCQAEQLLQGHPLDEPLTPAETSHILQHLSHLAQQGDLTGVQSLAEQLVNLFPPEEE